MVVELVETWRLSEATPEQRNKWELIGDGQGVHWPDIDEDTRECCMGFLLAVLTKWLLELID
jgi:hypothetical protein